MNGCVYSGLAVARLAAIFRILSLKGRAARIRSCALRILDAATISIALVIFFVFSTLLILPRISLPTAMSPYSLVVLRRQRFASTPRTLLGWGQSTASLNSVPQ